MSNFVKKIQLQFRSLANAEIAQQSRKYFKMEHLGGDEFLGIRVPRIRLLAKEHKDITLEEVEVFLRSPIHEERLFALLVMVIQFQHGSKTLQNRLYQCYLRNIGFVNQWDLIDSSAPQIVGEHLRNGSKAKLDQLAHSESLWERRIAMIATLAYVRVEDFDDALRIAELLVDDTEDLIQKAVGWTLREIGERDMAVEEVFLKKHAVRMPRTMLRYAIEKFPESKRQKYLKMRLR